MTPEQNPQNGPGKYCLAEHTLKSLGVNSDKPTAELVMDHAVAQKACS